MGVFFGPARLDTSMAYGYLQLSSQTSFSALTVSDIKTHLAITDTAWDSYIGTLLDASVLQVERALSLDLRNTTWKLVLEQFPLWAQMDWMTRFGDAAYIWPGTWEFAVGRTTQRWQAINLQRGPVQSVTSVTYYDPTNAQQTVDPTTYRFSQPSYFPGRLEPVTFWPVAYPRPDAVTITFVTGFTSIPASLLHAIKLLCGKWWASREALAYGPGTALAVSDEAIDCLLSQFMTGGYA